MHPKKMALANIRSRAKAKMAEGLRSKMPKPTLRQDPDQDHDVDGDDAVLHKNAIGGEDDEDMMMQRLKMARGG